MKYNFDDCLQYVNKRLGITLYPFQEVILKALCDGLEVRTARGIGRSYVADALENMSHTFVSKTITQ